MKKKLKVWQLLLIYLAIWLCCIAGFWVSGISDGIGYSVFVLWLTLPLSAFAFSFMISNRVPGRSKWFCVILFSQAQMLAEYFTFELANMITFHKTNMPEPTLMLIGAVASAAGIAVSEIYKRKSKK